MVLARCLEAFPGDTPNALRRYETLRHGRTTRVVQGSAANTGRFHNPVLADPAKARNYMAREYPPDKGRTAFDWLFEYDAMTVEI